MKEKIREIFDDFYFRHWGFKNMDRTFGMETVFNYNRYIKGSKTDTKQMKRYISRVRRCFNINLD